MTAEELIARGKQISSGCQDRHTPGTPHGALDA
jgi:hypothetical protein